MVINLPALYCLFLTFLLANGLNGQAQGYSAETQEVLDMPVYFYSYHHTDGLNREQLDRACQETKNEDGFKCRLIRAKEAGLYNVDSMLYYFRECVAYAQDEEIDYKLKGLVDLYLADYYLLIGRIRTAELLYQKIIVNTEEVHQLNWIAKIKLYAMKADEEGIEKINKFLKNESRQFFSDEIDSNLKILHSSSFSNIQRRLYIKENEEQFLSISDDVRKFIFLADIISLEFTFHNSGSRADFYRYIKEATEIYQRLENKESRLESLYFKTLAFVNIVNGDYKAASDYSSLACLAMNLDTSLSFDVNTSLLNNGYHTSLINNLGLSQLYLGPEGVKRGFEILYLSAEQNLLKQYGSLSAWDITYGLNDYKNRRLLQLSFIADYLFQEEGDISYLNRTMAMIDANRGALLYSQILRRNEIFKEGGLSKLLLKDQELARREYTIEIANSKEYLDEILAINEERQEIISELAQKYPDFLNRRTSITKDFIREQQSRLSGSNRTVLYFLYHQNFSTCILINSDSVRTDHVFQNTLKPNNLKALVHSYPQCVSLPPEIDEPFSPDCLAEGYELYQILFGDVEDLLKEEVLIIGDGPFSQLPFSSLPVDENGTEYLANRHRLSFNVSARLDEVMREREVNPKYQQVLGFSPSEGVTPVLSVRGTRKFGDLMNTGWEVDKIKEILPGTYYKEGKATKENLLKNMSDYSVVHLASHAKANDTDGMRSYLVLNDEEDGEEAPLFAAELANQNLEAELVVLSACETGSGSNHLNEGVLGLTHAFAAAGTKSILSSRWAVDDAATADLMFHFYEGLRDGLPKHEALQAAQQNYRETHRGTYLDHPYFWSAFILTGDQSPLSFQESPFPWLYLLMGLVGVGLAWLIYRRSNNT